MSKQGTNSWWQWFCHLQAPLASVQASGNNSRFLYFGIWTRVLEIIFRLPLQRLFLAKPLDSAIKNHESAKYHWHVDSSCFILNCACFVLRCNSVHSLSGVSGASSLRSFSKPLMNRPLGSESSAMAGWRSKSRLRCRSYKGKCWKPMERER